MKRTGLVIAAALAAASALSAPSVARLSRASSALARPSRSLGGARPTSSSLARVWRARGAVSMNTVEDLTDEVRVLKNELMRKDAIIEGLLATLSKTAITTAEYGVSSTPLTDLCEISKAACDAVTPMLQAFYEKISEDRHGGVSKLKSDATYFTIADGVVQHLFIEHLFAGDKFAQIVGEEDESHVQIKTKPYTVDELEVPAEFVAAIDAATLKIDQLSTRIDKKVYKDLTVFIDPIDGTREFATAQGEYVTMLIGYNDPMGKPVAGIMYRPLTTPCTWAAGAKSEEYAAGELDMASPPHPKGMLITDAAVSPFIKTLIDTCGMERIPSVASGNRAMMLLEGKGGAYIRDTGGMAKWDTSAPTAVLDAYGGTMSKLVPFLEDESLVPYTHLKAQKNLDFVPNAVQLTLSNAKDKKSYIKGEKFMVNSVEIIKEYSCVQGLFAINKDAMADVPTFREAMLKVRTEQPPTFT
jgi:3'(2'), 5'-bisphosphate nucleotidase